MKIRILTAILFTALLIFGITAFSQDDVTHVEDSAFTERMRPPVPFNHDEHNETAEIEECSVCHHKYEDGKLSREPLTGVAVRSLIIRANAGECHAAWRLLEEAAWQLENGNECGKDLSNYLSIAFRIITGTKRDEPKVRGGGAAEATVDLYRQQVDANLALNLR